ncbi:uncharacterized protein RHO25_004036 [Cercospora beticola]|uniref:Cyclochlorotine biosynthesis protein O n=1 Tax=Cercospora beticola TaxID=122368 RepID=A0ABZ0NIW2_CERBT|nr:hypothetical protein RHO25_004036 [Cercospora beticola]
MYVRRGLGADVYDTDFAPARQAIEMEQRHFTGAPLWDDEGLPYFSEEDKKIPYLGTSPVAIPAWEELIKDRYFLVTEEEARQAWGKDYKKYYRYPDIPGHPGGYVGGLDVLHSLHCVNELRKHLFDKNRCDQNQTEHQEAVDEYHIVHCLEMMRQNIECKSDLSLVPAMWWPSLKNGTGSSFIFSEQTHTCRNFEKVRQWASGRYARTKRMGKSKHLPPENV